MARKLTARQRTLNKEYSYQLSRIRRFLKGATQRGYIFPKNLIPPRPDKIKSKDVEQLKEMTAPSMYKEAHWVDPTTGEYVGAYEGRKTERRRAYQKGVERRKQRERKHVKYAPPEPSEYESRYEESRTDFYAEAVIKNFKMNLEAFNANGASILGLWVDNLIMKFGEGEVADMLERGAQAGVIIDYEVIYDEQMTRSFMADMVKYLWSMEPEDAESFGQAFYDALEEDDGFTTV